MCLNDRINFPHGQGHWIIENYFANPDFMYMAANGHGLSYNI